MKETLIRITLAILFLSTFASCRGQDVRGTVPAPLVNKPITQGTPQSVRAFEQRAMEVAKQWRSDAYMTGAQAIVPASRPDNTFTIRDRVTFNFWSKADPQHSYRVGFDSKGALDVFEFSDRAPQLDELPIESSNWPVDSLDAWRIARANGGSTLLEEYQLRTVDMRCSLTLRRWYPPSSGQVFWRVGCMDAVTLKSFYFEIDAQTGAVIEKGVE